MSETDDTDDLLLIPPDFFVIDSDSSHSNTVQPYYNIVDNLIQKVNNLQDRIQSIESSSISNSLEHWLDQSQNMQNNNSGFRKYNSSDDIYIPHSTQSTPQKPHSKFKLNSLPASPNVDGFGPLRNARGNKEIKSPTKSNLSPKTKSSPKAFAHKEDDRTLSEIDTFLSKVKTIQRINAARSLENDFNEGDNKRSVKEIDRLISERNQQKPRNELDLAKKEDELLRNELITKEKTWRQGDNKGSVPDYGMGVRNMLYSKPRETYRNQAKYVNDLSNESWTSVDKYPLSDSSSDSTQLTAFNKYAKSRNNPLTSPLHMNALNVINKHKELLENSAQKNKFRDHKPRGNNTVNDTLGLLSLAEIWNSNHLLHLNPHQLAQKLQEEKLRRQHCEELIHELQNRNLELQQKLSVAVKVDDSKNQTIRQFQEALEKIVTRLEKLNKEKQDWDQEISKLKSRHSNEMEEATQKIAYHEKEASKALNLAHGNQEKLASLERRCSSLEGELKSVEKRCNDIQEEYSRELERNRQLSEILSQKEIEINENKITLNDARLEVAQSKKAVELCQAEFSTIKTDCAKLHDDLKQEMEQCEQLKEQKKLLLNEMDKYKNREAELQDELVKTKKQMENSKVELRNFYQGQVEILVQNKLKEFQNQLDLAETGFKEEIKKREMSIAKTAAVHIQRISEKYSIEIKLLEKKHEEETKLYQIQIMQYKQQVEELQNKLEQFHEKRMQIAKQLQKIMESQWNEALRIIASGKSPIFNDGTFSTIDQLNSLKTRSYNNVEEVLAQQQEEKFSGGRRQKNERHFSLQEEEISSISNNEEKNAQEGFSVPVETPVSSRGQGNKQYNENEIQKYINLLLNRPPGYPTQEAQHRDSEKLAEGITERASWQQAVRPRKHK